MESTQLKIGHSYAFREKRSAYPLLKTSRLLRALEGL